ncbi:MAG: Kazal-type serine protease inhibitor domain-containing protein, partial [Candidatus Micrarchaeota archaeon]
MRGIIVLLLIAGLLVFGCSTTGNQDGANTTNQTNQTPIETCEGPVCGSDGATYATDCQAELAGVSIQYAGECVAPPELNCSDSDGGLEPSVFGTASKGNETRDDYCLDGNQLIEYSCLDNALQMATVQCGANKTCQGGRCANVTAPPDQNVTPPTAGCSGMIAADIYRKDSVTFNGTVYEDSCIEFKVVKDYFCEGEQLQAINNQCPSGFACADGACYRLSFNCTETDDGNDTTKRGKTTVYKGLITTFDEYDDCVDEGTV